MSNPRWTDAWDRLNALDVEIDAMGILAKTITRSASEGGAGAFGDLVIVLGDAMQHRADKANALLEQAWVDIKELRADAEREVARAARRRVSR